MRKKLPTEKRILQHSRLGRMVAAVCQFTGGKLLAAVHIAS
jgi:hypothetical protein